MNMLKAYVLLAVTRTMGTVSVSVTKGVIVEMVTAAWVLVGIIVLVLLYRLALWYLVKWSDASYDSIEPVEVHDAPKWVDLHRDSPTPETTGIVPGGVSYVQEPSTARHREVKSGNRIGRLRK